MSGDVRPLFYACVFYACVATDPLHVGTSPIRFSSLGREKSAATAKIAALKQPATRAASIK